jgi:hypothetical protein
MMHEKRIGRLFEMRRLAAEAALLDYSVSTPIAYKGRSGATEPVTAAAQRPRGEPTHSSRAILLHESKVRESHEPLPSCTISIRHGPSHHPGHVHNLSHARDRSMCFEDGTAYPPRQWLPLGDQHDAFTPVLGAAGGA